MSTPAPATRRVRIVCISDTHDASPKHGSFKLPRGDILIHAGDLTNQGTYGELAEVVEWMAEAEGFQAKVIIAALSRWWGKGNHDLTLDKEYYEQVGFKFNNTNPQSTDRCIELMQKTASQKGIIYLEHEPRHITITHTEENGTKTTSTLKFFGSPWIPSCGPWAFSYRSPDTRTEELTLQVKELWSQIPPDTDVLVTHGPAKGHCDANPSGLSGCEILAEKVKQVRPLLHVHGHVHAGRGYERIRWDEQDANGRVIIESSDVTGKAGDGKTQGLVDLTGRRKDEHGFAGRKVQNDLKSGRKETCVINPAIKSGVGAGGNWNAPIVVEIDLPVD
ncbi:hypothetical protein KEM56_001946 [Ascosphaera pollenicola]|nr:hypothetical protein KEM56_001946 [Ascosphaera pollenicola]